MKNPYEDHLDRLCDRDRAQVFQLIQPAGAAFHVRHTYQLLEIAAPKFGVCWHGHVCVTAPAGWIHPAMTAGRVCDDPPVLMHVGIY